MVKNNQDLLPIAEKADDIIGWQGTLSTTTNEITRKVKPKQKGGWLYVCIVSVVVRSRAPNRKQFVRKLGLRQ